MTWTKGRSGNPTGRPRKAPEVRASLAAMLPDVAVKLAGLLKSENPDDVKFAIKTTLEWTLPKPAPMPASTTGDRLKDFIDAALGRAPSVQTDEDDDEGG